MATSILILALVAAAFLALTRSWRIYFALIFLAILIGIVSEAQEPQSLPIPIEQFQ